MSIDDKQIGRNLTRLRGDMSQKELADQMKARGWRWSQATVWSVEKGERPLRLAESDDLLSILGTAWPLTLRDGDSEVTTWMRHMSEANAELERATERFLSVQEQLWAAKEREDVSPRIKDLAEGWLKDKPEDVVREKRLLISRLEDAEEARWTDGEPEATD